MRKEKNKMICRENVKKIVILGVTLETSDNRLFNDYMFLDSLVKEYHYNATSALLFLKVDCFMRYLVKYKFIYFSQYRTMIKNLYSM